MIETSPQTPAADAAVDTPETQIAQAPAALEAAGAHPLPERCENCDAPVTGPFCAQCGQKHGHSIHSVWEFLSEAVEGLTHADSRLWQTLVALLTRPGALTREFLDGHRVRYLPPLRLYLVLSLAFFVLAELIPQEASVVSISTGGGETSGFRISRTPVPGAVDPKTLNPDAVNDICGEVLKEPIALLSHFGRSQESVMGSCRKFLNDGGAAFHDVFVHNVERGLFVFLPLLALFAWPLYRHPRRYYVEHLLFFVHNHAFLFLILTLSRLATMANPVKAINELMNIGIFFYVVWYLYTSMRRVYGESPMLTTLKLSVLAFLYALTSLLGIVITATYTALTL